MLGKSNCIFLSICFLFLFKKEEKRRRRKEKKIIYLFVIDCTQCQHIYISFFIVSSHTFRGSLLLQQLIVPRCCCFVTYVPGVVGRGGGGWGRAEELLLALLLSSVSRLWRHRDLEMHVKILEQSCTLQ